MRENGNEDANRNSINWFPGHMAKTRRKIKESLSLVDGVVELRDARIPLSSVNPELNDLIEGKPKLILLNKCDLADEKATGEWLAFYKKQGIAAIPVDCKSGKGLNIFKQTVHEVLADTIKRNNEKGMSGRALRLMVVGIPNTGKSSFINRMIGTSKAKVADKPGVTKHNQWFNIGGGIELLDTPGVLWPKFDDPKVGDRLSFIGSVKDEVVDVETMAVRLIEVLARDYTSMLTERYKLGNIDGLEDYEILELIGRKRGMLISGGEIDTERAANTLLDEYRGGKLGKITLERP